ncbi:hypothetical protein Dimus_035686 [Dionaea muscipula]
MVCSNVDENEVVNNDSIGKSLKIFLSDGDAEECTTDNSAQDTSLTKTISQNAGLNGDRRAASSGSDTTLSSSDSSYGLDTPREHGGANSIQHTMSAPNCRDLQRAPWEWALVPAHDSSAVGSTNSSMGFFPSGRSQLALDESVENLKSNFVNLSRKVELSELELQTLRKQIVKESKRGQDLLREVASLKEERDALKEEYEKLKASQRWGDEMRVSSTLKFEGDPWALLEESRQELNCEKNLNVNLRLQLQKTQESYSELLLAVQDLEEMLEQNNRRECDPSMKPSSTNTTEESEKSIPLYQSDEDEEQKVLEELVQQHTNAKGTYLQEQRIMDLCSEIEIYRREKDELEIQMEQLALDYEILKQEHHDMSYKLGHNQIHEQLKLQYECSNSHPAQVEHEARVEKLENELKNQSNELSVSLATIRELETHIQNLEGEIEKQAHAFDAELQVVTRAQSDQELMVEKLEKELERRSREFSDCVTMIKELETRLQELDDEKEKQAQEFEANLQAVTHAKLDEEIKIGKLEDELKQKLKESSEYVGTINQLETHVQGLEEELANQARGFTADLQAVTRAKLDQELRMEKLENKLIHQSKKCSDYLGVIKDLQCLIQNLEDELEKQEQGFEADLEAVTRAKVEQEQRAIRAEEALRLTRWKNVNTAERIQDEFRRLSNHMQSTFEANEKLATKALTEASQLRLQNSHLEEMLQKAMDELQSVKDDYEAKLHELYHQIEMKGNKLNQLLMESQEKSMELEHQKKHEHEARQRFSVELAVLRDEITRLKADNCSLSKQAEQTVEFKSELEQKSLFREREHLMETGNMERENLEGAVALVKEEAEKSLDELNVVRHLKAEKEMAVKIIQDEVDNLRVQFSDLRQSCYEDELEKEKLRIQVMQLKNDINNEDALATMERKLRDTNGTAAVTDRPKATPQLVKPEPVPCSDKEVETLREKVKQLQGDYYIDDDALIGNTYEEGKSGAENVSKMACVSAEDRTPISLVNSDMDIPYVTQLEAPTNGTKERQVNDLLKEVMLLKERNNSMETELKEMQERYSEISLKFAEVEGERQKLVMSLRSLTNSKKSS